METAIGYEYRWANYEHISLGTQQTTKHRLFDLFHGWLTLAFFEKTSRILLRYYLAKDTFIRHGKHFFMQPSKFRNIFLLESALISRKPTTNQYWLIDRLIYFQRDKKNGEKLNRHARYIICDKNITNERVNSNATIEISKYFTHSNLS